MSVDSFSYLPILLQVAIVGTVVGLLITLTHLLGPRNNWGKKLNAFACGIREDGDARESFAIKYFLVAILFVLFDVEVVFFYPYALQVKTLGKDAFVAVLVFIGIFGVGFLYVLRKKVLSWDD